MHSRRRATASLTRLLLWPINVLRRGVRLGLSTLEILLAAFGAVAALVVTALLTPALNQLPGTAGDFAAIGVAILLVPAGMAIALGRRPEVERFFSGVRERTDTVTEAIVPPGVARGVRSGVVVDTSAIIDGRLAEIVESGFLLGDLIVPRFVLDELRRVADSSDTLKRRRGRHGLELLSRIQAGPHVKTIIDERAFPEAPDVDAKLLALARIRGAALLTTDFNLNRVAGVEDLRVLNINVLAQAVRTVALPGETLHLPIHQPGRERRQGVGFLTDGTMVVVEEARDLVGQDVAVEVQRVIQTAAGRMLFAQLRPPAPGADAAETPTGVGAEGSAGASS